MWSGKTVTCALVVLLYTLEQWHAGLLRVQHKGIVELLHTQHACKQHATAVVGGMLVVLPPFNITQQI
jgi:hypothetical protein